MTTQPRSRPAKPRQMARNTSAAGLGGGLANKEEVVALLSTPALYALIKPIRVKSVEKRTQDAGFKPIFMGYCSN